ncbi:MAG: hypothetical protein DDT40_01299 [candidate division WS2 bacterium]|nr:hypothetical protein [Candidatus Psychracetigena formicireducens]
MSYKVVPEIPHAKGRTKGRLWQTIGKTKVPKYAYSPYTAKPDKQYMFFADVALVEFIESPPEFFTTNITLRIHEGLFIDFKKNVLNGAIPRYIEEYVLLKSGWGSESVEYWRNKGV